MNHIAIELPQRDFTGGETITGNVIVTLDQPLPVRGVRLALRGYEKSHWSTGSGKNRRTHSERREFFEDEFTLFGKPRLALGDLLGDSIQALFSKASYETHPAGTMPYSFTYTLPERLPGDYQSPMSGSEIRYLLRAEVDLPLKLDLSATQELTIYERRNFTESQPVAAAEQKKFLFSSAAGIDLAIMLPKQKFFLGETTTCQVQVDNRSDRRDLEMMELAVVQTERLVAHSRETTRSQKIGEVRFPNCAIPPHQQRQFELPFRMPGPAECYPDIQLGQLVQVRHELVARLDIPWALDLQVSAPVTLLEIAGAPAGVRE